MHEGCLSVSGLAFHREGGIRTLLRGDILIANKHGGDTEKPPSSYAL